MLQLLSHHLPIFQIHLYSESGIVICKTLCSVSHPNACSECMLQVLCNCDCSDQLAVLCVKWFHPFINLGVHPIICIIYSISSLPLAQSMLNERLSFYPQCKAHHVIWTCKLWDTIPWLYNKQKACFTKTVPFYHSVLWDIYHIILCFGTGNT